MKIFKSLFVIVSVTFLLTSASWAYFQDLELSNENIVQTGTLDLKVNGGDDPAVGVISVENGLPGKSGAAAVNLVNSGNTAGKLGIDMSEEDIFEGACAVNGVNDGSEYCDESADLGQYLNVAFFVDLDKDGKFNNNDIGIKSDGTLYSSGSGVDYQSLSSYAGTSWNNVLSTMSTGTEVDFMVSWEIPSEADNSIQGDRVNFGVSFLLEQ
jgi:hypothetical protein